jgi:hypothetical protein
VRVVWGQGHRPAKYPDRTSGAAVSGLVFHPCTHDLNVVCGYFEQQQAVLEGDSHTLSVVVTVAATSAAAVALVTVSHQVAATPRWVCAQPVATSGAPVWWGWPCSQATGTGTHSGGCLETQGDTVCGCGTQQQQVPGQGLGLVYNYQTAGTLLFGFLGLVRRAYWMCDDVCCVVCVSTRPAAVTS